MAGTPIENAALFAILSSLADNKQAIGRRYAYWCNGAPALEAAVAAAAMTQDEIGHARTLYPLLEDFTQAEADPRQVDPMTRTLQYHLSSLDHDFQGWSDFVATNFLVDTALTTFFAAAQNSRYEPLRQRSRKIVQEERLHEMHADGCADLPKPEVLYVQRWWLLCRDCGMRRCAGLVPKMIRRCNACITKGSSMPHPTNWVVATCIPSCPHSAAWRSRSLSASILRRNAGNCASRFPGKPGIPKQGGSLQPKG